MRIVDLLAEERWDVPWLRKAVQTAIELELSTIPPYLCALWSIADEGSAAETLINGIVFDEMGHMGLMCNLLRGLGGVPQIKSAAPRFPGPLPGGVRPELTVYLSGLNRDMLHDVLMGIERPEHPLVEDATFPSIGRFYGAIETALTDGNPSIVTDGQLTHAGVGLVILPTVAEAIHATDRIRGQGEGTSSSAIFDGEVAHFYQFGELYHGRTIVESPTGTFTFTGDDVPFPRTLPMARVPAGGWVNRDPDGNGTLKAFNSLYSALLEQLDAAWNGGGQPVLQQAVAKMRRMKTPAQTLMKVPLEGCPGHYGPDFKID